MTHLVSLISNWIASIISGLGYGGIILLMGIESAAIPLPSEIIAPFAGYLVFLGKFSLLWVAVAGGIGSTLGSALTYGLGLYIGRPFVEKYGKYILITPHDLRLADTFFAKYGSFSTFIGRLIPVVRTFISIPAGIERINFWKFLLYSFIGSFIWTYFLAYVGMKLGEHWADIHEKFRSIDAVVGIIIVLGACYWVYRHVKHLKKR